MPELVRTSLWTLLPDSLSATIDFSSLSLAFQPIKTPNQSTNERSKPDIASQSTQPPALTSTMRWSHSASDRKPLCRNALIATRNHRAVRFPRDLGFRGRRERSGREIRSPPGAPRELDHAGGVEGTSAPARRRGAAGEEERNHRVEEEVAAEIHGAARWEGDERCGT